MNHDEVLARIRAQSADTCPGDYLTEEEAQEVLGHPPRACSLTGPEHALARLALSAASYWSALVRGMPDTYDFEVRLDRHMALSAAHDMANDPAAGLALARIIAACHFHPEWAATFVERVLGRYWQAQLTFGNEEAQAAYTDVTPEVFGSQVPAEVPL